MCAQDPLQRAERGRAHFRRHDETVVLVHGSRASHQAVHAAAGDNDGVLEQPMRRRPWNVLDASCRFGSVQRTCFCGRSPEAQIRAAPDVLVSGLAHHGYVNQRR